MPVDFEPMKQMQCQPEDTDDQEHYNGLWELQGRRQDILSKVESGKITPEEADRLAVEENLGPFSKSASLEDFNPQKRQSWSIEMVLAWIISRNYDLTAEFDEEYREACMVWHLKPRFSPFQKQSHKQFELRWGRAASVPELTDFASSLQKPRMSFDKAKSELWDALIAGRVQCTAVKEGGLKLIDIEPGEWLHLGLFYEEEMLKLRCIDSKTIYRRARFSKDQIINEWKYGNRGRPIEFNWDVLSKKFDEILESRREGDSRTSARLIDDLLDHFATRRDHMINQDPKAEHKLPDPETVRGRLVKNKLDKSMR